MATSMPVNAHDKCDKYRLSFTSTLSHLEVKQKEYPTMTVSFAFYNKLSITFTILQQLG